MGRKKRYDPLHVDRFLDPVGFDPFAFLAPLSEGGAPLSSSSSSSGSGSSGGSNSSSGGSNSSRFEIGGRATLKKGDHVGASALFRDLKLDSMFGKEFLSVFNLQGEGEFDLNTEGTSSGSGANTHGRYEGKKVKDLFTAFLAEAREGPIEQQSEEYEIKALRSQSALAQGYANVDRGNIDLWGSGSASAGSALNALKELAAKIAEESKGKAQAIARIARTAEGKEIMQRLGGATANWQISGGHLNVRKQVMMSDG